MKIEPFDPSSKLGFCILFKFVWFWIKWTHVLYSRPVCINLLKCRIGVSGDCGAAGKRHAVGHIYRLSVTSFSYAWADNEQLWI